MLPCVELFAFAIIFQNHKIDITFYVPLWARQCSTFALFSIKTTSFQGAHSFGHRLDTTNLIFIDMFAFILCQSFSCFHFISLRTWAITNADFHCGDMEFCGALWKFNCPLVCQENFCIRTLISIVQQRNIEFLSQKFQYFALENYLIGLKTMATLIP